MPDYPASKLDIKLIFEESDPETLQAAKALKLPDHFEFIVVPDNLPRTKPKACNFALPFARGDYLVIYDAEDSPEPLQLRKAVAAFTAGDGKLACVQAQLNYYNWNENWLTRQFAIEYAAFFDLLLPTMVRLGMPIPLGGTSTHFRTSVLREAGAWDPNNVTEDADLGVRLARFGYRTQTIACPTAEPAPVSFATWLPQRTRWFKGWMQTWLVHMRDPVRLVAELGPGSFLIAQILFAGMVVSALAHPFLVVTGLVLLVDLAMARPMTLWKSMLFGVDLVNVACGYLSFLLLGWQTLGRSERRGFWKVVLFTPVYWMMMSLAAWRAVWQLCRRPHHWEKTPHPAWAAPGLARAPLEEPRAVADDLGIRLADHVHVAPGVV